MRAKELELKGFNNQVAILQLENLHNVARIEAYMKSLSKGTIILIGEYVVDPFFSDKWKTQADSVLKDKHKLDVLQDFCNKYQHIIVAPIVQYKNKGYYKNIAIFTQNNKIETYTQQRLMQYSHWNEVEFFSNDVSKLPHKPLTFLANGIRFGVLFGFEVHYDEFWMEFKRANVDVVLVATANTFSSHERWKNLLTTHAFTNLCYVFRANRIGKFMAQDGYEWDFYGHSFVVLGQDIVDSLENEEGMLCVEIDTKLLENLKDEWKFR